jgi:hypothetical protein
MWRSMWRRRSQRRISRRRTMRTMRVFSEILLLWRDIFEIIFD